MDPRRGLQASKMNNNPLITIVTVVYNGGATLERTILSVLNQVYQPVEYIILDGGSTDNTVEIIKKYEDKLAFWKSEPDKGIYDAMNKAIDHAKGEWINFMNCGDRFANENTLLIFQEKHDDTDLLYGDALVEYGNFNAIFKKHALTSIWRSSPFCHQAAFARTALMKAYRFDLSYRIGADHDFFYRAYKGGKNFEYIPMVICYFDGTDGITKSGIVQAIRDKEKTALKYDYSLGKVLYYKCFLMSIHLRNAVKKMLGRKLMNKIKRMIKEESIL